MIYFRNIIGKNILIITYKCVLLTLCDISDTFSLKDKSEESK